MGKRPEQHVDDSANKATAFKPEFVAASDKKEPIRVLMYGDNGTGKTYSAGTYPKPIFLSLDPGFLTLKSLPNSDDIQIVSFPDPAQEGLEIPAQIWNVIKWLQTGDHDRQTIVLDSVTELHRVIMEVVMKKPRQRQAPTIPSTDDYIEVNAKVESLLRHLRNLPLNLVLTGHHKVQTDKSGAIIGARLNVSEKLSTSIGGMMDLVLHTSVHTRDGENGQEVAYVGQTIPVNNIQAKNRDGKMRAPYSKITFDVINDAYNILEVEVSDDDGIVDSEQTGEETYE